MIMFSRLVSPSYRSLILGLVASLAALPNLTGCASWNALDSADQYGRTYYIDGAGNWGFGVADITGGLRRAGYQGNIINFRWSPTFNPALDQTVGRPVARLKGRELGREITQYLGNHPQQQVNIIALSAGTGVAVWACENTTLPAKVHNLVLLGSSLSSTYDTTEAIRHLSGAVFVYHSESDMILQGPVRTLGTIDGKLGVDSAGIVGLHPPTPSDRIHNIRWDSRFEQLGWSGSHTDATSEPFVNQILARHILPTGQELHAAAGDARLSMYASHSDSELLTLIDE